MVKLITMLARLSLLLLLSACSSAAVQEWQAPYTVNLGGNGKTYYHLMYDLNPKNVVMVERFTQTQFVENGGQFDVHIKKSEFPIEAPKCKSDIILRMPWVTAQIDVSQKYQLYLAILAVLDSKQATVSVVIELNPYVEKNAHGIQLQHCNVFFRHNQNHYVPYIHALAQS